MIRRFATTATKTKSTRKNAPPDIARAKAANNIRDRAYLAALVLPFLSGDRTPGVYENVRTKRYATAPLLGFSIRQIPRRGALLELFEKARVSPDIGGIQQTDS